MEKCKGIKTIIYHVYDFCKACNITFKEMNEVFEGIGPTESVFLDEMDIFIDECHLMINEGDEDEVKVGKKRLEVINKVLAARDKGIIESDFILQWDY